MMIMMVGTSAEKIANGSSPQSVVLSAMPPLKGGPSGSLLWPGPAELAASMGRSRRLPALRPRPAPVAVRVRSISDWKNDYLDICHSCSVRDACGGVFTTSDNRLSQRLRPLP